MAVVRSGNVVVVGETYSPDFPTTADAAQSTFPSLLLPGYDEIGYYTRFDGNLSILSSSFPGGTQGDTPATVTIAPSGLTGIAGISDSSDFLTSGSFERSSNAFLVLLDFNSLNSGPVPVR